MEFNPYAAPQSRVLQVTPQAEIDRMQHINTEATIKSVGVLYYLGALALTVAGVAAFTGREIEEGVPPQLLGAIFVAMGAGQGVVGYGLRGLQSWARIPTVIFSCIGLIGFPLGTLINAYILAKVLGKQGKFVMTPEYKEIIAATPHVKRKTSIVVWVLLILLLIILIGIIAAVTMGK
ncbi:hypothetical protein [Prosthecobacter sp.]|uniref:hypothetical protein n=1 Tax=Prosthecobacter sp. TaxID=1965333 RepID=UPI001DFA4625|nr:hypothetical protein [Prosthecobacter sp.]MCB1277094.1 hypothetical protein [Prosthecobacter sp.]